METATAPGSAVDDHHEAEAERAEAERVRLEEEQAALDNEPSRTEPGEGDEPGLSAVPDPDDGQGDEPAPEGTPPAEPTLVGIDGQLSFGGIGGKAPTSATVRLTGGKISLPVGQLKKGSDVVMRVVARVKGVAFEDELDGETKQAIGCERRHSARILDVGLLDAEGSLRAAVEAGRAQGIPDEDLVKALESLLSE